MGNATESYKTESAESASSSTKTIKIPVSVKSAENRYNGTFHVDAAYSKKEILRNIIDVIIEQMNNKYYPLKFKVIWIYSDNSFVREGISGADIYKSFESIINYKKKEIIKKGLCIEMDILKYSHNISLTNITCKHMLSENTINPLKCPIYFRMKQKYEHNINNLQHLNEFKHFKNELNDREECKHQNKCGSYIRLENGGNKISDLCHIKLYRHPPRNRNIELEQKDINCLIFNKKPKQNFKVYEPTNIDITLYNHIYGHTKEWNHYDGFLYSLLEEVINNDFESDLHLKDNETEEFLKKIDLKMQNSISTTVTREQIFSNNNNNNNGCKTITNTIAYEQYTILGIVDNKLNSYRHKAMGSPLNRAQMLSLILYTGCNCSYDLSNSQRNGNYNKWKWFDYCLYHAVCLLSSNENGLFDVYSGLNKVRLNKKNVKGAYFVTYVSASWNRLVAKSFIDGNGMMLHIDKQFKNNNRVNCCDVSWISKFPDECEVLFARSTEDWTDKGFNFIVKDYQNKIQTVSLSLIPKVNNDNYNYNLSGKHSHYSGVHKNRLYSFNDDENNNNDELPEEKIDLSPTVSVEVVTIQDIVGIVHKNNVSVQYNNYSNNYSNDYNNNSPQLSPINNNINLHQTFSDMAVDVDNHRFSKNN